MEKEGNDKFVAGCTVSLTDKLITTGQLYFVQNPNTACVNNSCKRSSLKEQIEVPL